MQYALLKVIYQSIRQGGGDMEIVMESRLTHAVALQTTPRPSLTCKDKLEYMNNSLHTAASHNVINTFFTMQISVLVREYL